MLDEKNMQQRSGEGQEPEELEMDDLAGVTGGSMRDNVSFTPRTGISEDTEGKI